MATSGTTGILTPQQEQQLAVWLDNMVKLKGLWELVDGYVFRVVITLLDDKLVDKLKEDLKAKLSELVDAALAGEVDEAEQLATDILVGLVHIPGIDSTIEGLIFGAAIELAVAAVLNKLQPVAGHPIVLKVAEAKAKLAKPTKKTKRSWE
jgi:hypothetical protein